MQIPFSSTPVEEETAALVPLARSPAPPGTLVEQAGRIFRLEESEEQLSNAGDDPCYECPNGYIRHAPMQHYRIPPEYWRRRVRNILIGAAAAVLAVLLVVAVARSGLFQI